MPESTRFFIISSLKVNSVQINHAENVIAAIEVDQPVADGPKVVADVDMARRLDTRKYSFFHVPSNSLTLAPMSSSRIRDSPTKIASTPAASSRSTSPRSPMPLSLTTTASSGICSTSAKVVSKLVSKVRKSRLLTPMSRAPAALARVSSAPS